MSLSRNKPPKPAQLYPLDPDQIADTVRGVANLLSAASCHEGLNPEACAVLSAALDDAGGPGGGVSR